MPSAAFAVRITSRPHTAAVIVASSSPRPCACAAPRPGRGLALRTWQSSALARGRRSGERQQRARRDHQQGAADRQRRRARLTNRRNANSIVKIGKLQITGTVRETPTRRSATHAARVADQSADHDGGQDQQDALGGEGGRTGRPGGQEPDHDHRRSQQRTQPVEHEWGPAAATGGAARCWWRSSTRRGANATKTPQGDHRRCTGTRRLVALGPKKPAGERCLGIGVHSASVSRSDRTDWSQVSMMITGTMEQATNPAGRASRGERLVAPAAGPVSCTVAASGRTAPVPH